MEGNNPASSSQFPGSATGTDNTLGPGNYVVEETRTQSVVDDETTFQANHPEVIGFGYLVSFTGDCTNVINSFEKTGTIAAGESQTCNTIILYFLLVFPEPTTATLTVKKEVFGWDELIIFLEF